MLFVVVIVVLAGLTAAIARATKTPHPFGLLLAGIALGLAVEVWPALAPSFRLSQGTMFGVLLPPLLFEAAYALPAPELKKLWAPSVALAGPGLILGATLATAATWWALRALHDDVPFATLVILGAVLSATDPVAVVAVLRQARAPASLRTVLDAESLLNDGIAVVVLRAALGATSGHVAWARISGEAGWEIAAGLVIGWATAEIAGRLARAVPMLALLLSLGVAFGAFRAAEIAHASGILAVLAAGVTFARRSGPSPSCHRAWDAVAFAANSVVFLLVGLEIDPARLRADAIAILVAWLALLASRFVVVEASLFATRERTFRGWHRAALVLGGLRGGLSITLALMLGDARVLDITAGVVLLTLAAQGGLLFAARRRFG